MTVKPNAGTISQKHRDKFGPLVTDRIKKIVLETFGDRLFESTDVHFNNIPLKLWDKLAMHISGGSLAEKVCTLKEAARQIIEEKA